MAKPNPAAGDPARTLHQQMLRECEEMAKYTLASGLKVPGPVWEELESFSGNEAKERPDEGGEHAQTGGRRQAPSGGMARLASVHDQLTDIVAPATPRTILLLATESTNAGFWHFLGPVSLARQMMLAALVSLCLFMTVAVSSYVNEDANFGDIFLTSGWAAFISQTFLLAAAGLGASFAALYQIHRYIGEGTFDPKYVASYWVKFAMGLVAGIVMAELVNEPGGGSSSSQGITRPILAMVGGFSASVLYRILIRLTDTVESLFSDVRGAQGARPRAAGAQQAERSSEENLKVASNLMGLQKMLQTGADSNDLQQHLERMLKDLMPGVYSPAVPAAGAEAGEKAAGAAEDSGRSPDSSASEQVKPGDNGARDRASAERPGVASVG